MSLTTEQGEPDEQAVIDGICASAATLPPWVRVGPGDDAAVLASGAVLATDAMVQGVHWDLRVTPAQVGFKLARTNLSDVAAMGAEARWALLTLALPTPVDPRWVTDFGRGLAVGLDGVPLLGGDTTRSPGPVTATLTVGGQLVGPPLLRSGARPGDLVWVSGALGAAARAFASGETATDLWQAWVRPAPPLALGPALARDGLATAAMDLSDGLARDLARLCAASGCGARIAPDQLPTVEPVDLTDAEILRQVVGWGEDYGLLFTSPPRHRARVAALGARLDLALTPIGECTAEPGVALTGLAWPSPWRHFGGGSP